MLSKVRTPSGAIFKGVLQLEATFIDVKTCISKSCFQLEDALESGSKRSPNQG